MSATPPSGPVSVPPALADTLIRHEKDAGRAFVAALPGLAERCLDRWRLRPDGRPRHGVAALVLPVLRRDGTAAALKLQPLTGETVHEVTALRLWDGDGAVRVLEHDPATGALLLERLDPARALSGVADAERAVRILAGLLGRLTSRPAPPGLRDLADVAAAMVDGVEGAARALRDPAEAALLRRCASVVDEVRGGGGGRLLHWDLHYDNVLAPVPGAGREPWLAIDPKPLAGDPGFELMPALANRWRDVVATGDVARAVRRRFDLLAEAVGVERGRAAAWTLGRVLQNSLWDVQDGAVVLDPVQVAVAGAVLPRL